jgi:hypothetical protein
VEIARARLQLIIVPKITSKFGMATNADPTMIPNNVKVESNRVLMKNRRRPEPSCTFFSQFLKRSNITNFIRNPLECLCSRELFKFYVRDDLSRFLKS